MRKQVNNTAADQTAHPSNLINAFVVYCLASAISQVSLSNTS